MLFFAGKRGDEQVGHLAAGLQGRLVARVLVIGHQADQVVLVRPDVPIGAGEQPEPLARRVGAKVSVGLLALDQFGGDAIQFLSQARIARVGPGQRGGVHPLADVFADPGVAARPLVVSRQERHGVDDEQPLALIGVDPRLPASRRCVRPRARAPRRHRAIPPRPWAARVRERRQAHHWLPKLG